jgi:NAD(P)-dependent dehydrogenase (short-subunit alcohol dehydrogenase family)
LRRLASGRRPGGERRWRHSSPTSRPGLGAQIGRRGAGPLSKAGCARQQRRRNVRNTAADKDGIELTWAVNHLAPFLLSKLVLHRLKESAPARIITAASQAHQGAHIPFNDLNADRSYRGFGRYGETKLANILFTTELARRLDGTGVTANCFHPGLVATGFNRNNGLLMDLVMTMLRPMSRSPEKGAETLVWLAISPDVANVSGGYFFDQEQRPPSPEAQDEEAARRLWEISDWQCAGSARSAEASS